ncbi:MAG: hypothetical protein H6685_03370 [Deltaproteobacteria bacterium]|nr:hypothetical protein [Deltaproteobacteria bacterium]
MTPVVKRVLIALIVFGALVRLGMLIHFPNLDSAEAESYSKLNLLLQWDEPTSLWYPDTNFGPLHMPILWLPYKLTGSLVGANRFVAWLFSVGLMLPIFFLVRRVAGDKEALAAVALLTMAALPLAVGTITLAEGPYLFFFFTALMYFARLIDKAETHRTHVLLLFALFANAAMAMRFESWMFLPMWPLVIWYMRGFKLAAAASALLSAFPILHMTMSYKIVHHPLGFLIQSAQITAMNSAQVPLDERAVSWFKTLIAVEGEPMLVAGILGVIVVLAGRKARLIAGFFLWHFIVVEIQALRAAMAPELYRYAALMVVLLIPPSAQLVVKITTATVRKHDLWIPTAVGASLLLSASTLPYLSRVQTDVDLANVTYLTADALGEHLTAEDRLFMSNEAHPHLVVESGLPWKVFHLPMYTDGQIATPEACKEVFDRVHPTAILVYRHDPTFAETLGIDACEPTEVFGNTYAPVWEHDPWCLLRREDVE